MFSQILSFGYLPAVVLTGYWIVSNPLNATCSQLSPTGRLGISGTLGILTWFPLLFAAAWFNSFNPSWIGIAGWIASAVFAFLIWKKKATGGTGWRSKESLAVFSFAAAVCLFNAIYSSESILGGRDQGIYSNHGAHIANTGMLRSEPPYEHLYVPENYSLARPVNANGYFFDIPKGDMYMQFPPTLALHLAQFFGIGDYETLLFFNPWVAGFSILTFFALARLFLSSSWSFLATILFALNASQVWNARITLSEILAQNLILGGFCLAVAAYRSKHRAGYIAACIVGSGAAFTRVDGFLIPVLLILANLALSLSATDFSKEIRLLKPGSVAAFATMLVAYLYNLLTSPLYFHDFDFEIISLLSIGLTGLVALILAEKSSNARKALSFIVSPALLKRVAVLLVLLAIYGYFIRPYIEPFSQFKDSHYGTRNYRENSLLDLAKYISTPTLAFALFGACAALIGLRKKTPKEILIPLIPWLGFSILYLYDPRISADHIWRIRRFTPLIIPGFAFFAIWGASYVAHRYLKPTVQKLFFATSGIFCGVFLFTSLQPIAFLKQYKGSLDTIRSLSNTLPPGALTLANVSSEILSPLQLGEGHKMIRDHLDAVNISPIASKIIEYEFGNGREVFLLTEAPQGNSNFSVPIGIWKHHIPKLAKTPIAPASEVHIQKRDLYLHQLTHSMQKISAHQSYYSFGGTKVMNVEESGLHSQEFNGQLPFRWTNGDAKFTLKPSISRSPQRLIFKAYATHPEGSTVTLFANETQVFNGPVPSDTLTISVPLEGVKFNKSGNEFRIISKKWIPSELTNQSSDKRELGIAIEDITLMFDESIRFGDTTFGNIPVRGIKESGLYAIETAANRFVRWTNGRAVFSFELTEGYVPNQIELDLAGVIQSGRSLTVKWNDQVMHKGPLNLPLKTLKLPLDEGKTKGINVRLELICDPFVPSEIGINSDNRDLGLQIAGIRIKSVEK